MVVHVTASSEESAALATELARGVENHGRSRSEIPWETVSTLAQCRQRLEESRRMRHASLDMWPDAPYLDNRYEPWPGMSLNATGRFALGLGHDADHLGQIGEIVRQAKAAQVELIIGHVKHVTSGVTPTVGRATTYSLLLSDPQHMLTILHTLLIRTRDSNANAAFTSGPMLPRSAVNTGCV